MTLRRLNDILVNVKRVRVQHEIVIKGSAADWALVLGLLAALVAQMPL